MTQKIRTKHYETMFIVKPTLEAEEIQKNIKLVEETITSEGGKIVANEDLGTRTLAYAIDKHKRGYYYIVYFEAPVTAVKEIERKYRINENILRFIVIKYENATELKQFNTLVERAKKGEGSLKTIGTPKERKLEFKKPQRHSHHDDKDGDNRGHRGGYQGNRDNRDGDHHHRKPAENGEHKSEHKPTEQKEAKPHSDKKEENSSAKEEK